MLKIDKQSLDDYEKEHPGFKETLRGYEEANLPLCHQCGSENTAQVGVGLVGTSLKLVFSTTKFHLLANGPRPGKYFCNSCREYFGEENK